MQYINENYKSVGNSSSSKSSLSNVTRWVYEVCSDRGKELIAKLRTGFCKRKLQCINENCNAESRQKCSALELNKTKQYIFFIQDMLGEGELD